VERVVAPALVELPLERGEEVGEIRIYDGGRLIARRPLVPVRTIGEPTFGRRVGWYAGRTLDQAGGMLRTVFSIVG
jgi:hypothetical protein